MPTIAFKIRQPLQNVTVHLLLFFLTSLKHDLCRGCRQVCCSEAQMNLNLEDPGGVVAVGIETHLHLSNSKQCPNSSGILAQSVK